MNAKKKKLPTVYSCSGCSSAAQMANYLALELNRKKIAKMSCIAGVGGKVKGLVNEAKNSNSIVALDGCHLKCVENCLNGVGLKPTHHYILSNYNVQKNFDEDFNQDTADSLRDLITDELDTKRLTS